MAGWREYKLKCVKSENFDFTHFLQIKVIKNKDKSLSLDKSGKMQENKEEV